jgi:hypothetical protein
MEGKIRSVDSKVVQTQIPIRLLMEGEALVKAGWFCNLDDLFIEALRRYLYSHRPEFTERFMQQDVAWGLHGKDRQSRRSHEMGLRISFARFIS